MKPCLSSEPNSSPAPALRHAPAAGGSGATTSAHPIGPPRFSTSSAILRQGLCAILFLVKLPVPAAPANAMVASHPQQTTRTLAQVDAQKAATISRIAAEGHNQQSFYFLDPKLLAWAETHYDALSGIGAPLSPARFAELHQSLVEFRDSMRVQRGFDFAVRQTPPSLAREGRSRPVLAFAYATAKDRPHGASENWFHLRVDPATSETRAGARQVEFAGSARLTAETTAGLARGREKLLSLERPHGTTYAIEACQIEDRGTPTTSTLTAPRAILATKP